MVLYYFHFRDEKIEAQRSWETKPRPVAKQACYPGGPAPECVSASFSKAAVTNCHRLVTETVEAYSLSQLRPLRLEVQKSRCPRGHASSEPLDSIRSMPLPKLLVVADGFLVFPGFAPASWQPLPPLLHGFLSPGPLCLQWWSPFYTSLFPIRTPRIIRLWAHPIPLHLS